jgi:hypothetical protein
MIEDQVGRGGPADDRERAGQAMLDRSVPAPMPDQEAERRGRADGVPETIKTSLRHGVAPRINRRPEETHTILSDRSGFRLEQ